VIPLTMLSGKGSGYDPRMYLCRDALPEDRLGATSFIRHRCSRRRIQPMALGGRVPVSMVSHQHRFKDSFSTQIRRPMRNCPDVIQQLSEHKRSIGSSPHAWECGAEMRGAVRIMEKLSSILVVVDRNGGAAGCFDKALFLARHFGAKVELFLCDSERTYAMRQAYDQTANESSRHECLIEGRRYLDALRSSANSPGVEISVDVVCDSPLYEAIVHKVLRSQPDLVIKSASETGESSLGTFDANDWQTMRTCPTTLMLTRGRIWDTRPQVAAMVDVSGQETPGLSREILRASGYLTLGCRGALDVVYSECEEADAEQKASRARVLTELVHELHIRVDHVHVLSGNPEQTLPDFAARRYDVLVLGALTHREGLAPVVGTLTGKLVDALDCDFILVKSGGYRCPIQQPDLAVGDQQGPTGAALEAQRWEIALSVPPAVRATQKHPRHLGSVLWQLLFGD